MSTLKERSAAVVQDIASRCFYGQHHAGIVITREQLACALEEAFYSALLLVATSQTQEWASQLGRQTAKTQELINSIFIKPE
jgi:hypothetical protein